MKPKRWMQIAAGVVEHDRWRLVGGQERGIGRREFIELDSALMQGFNG
jgi:hypothetical protein